MSNDLQVSSSEILESLRLATMGINSLSQQMGLVVAGQQKLDQRMDRIEDRMKTYESNLRINRSQINRIKGAIMQQINYLLDLKFEGGVVAEESLDDAIKYRGGFISRLYCEAKRAGVMAECFWETPRSDYDKCMEFIAAWYPGVAGGVDGYKDYLDRRREKREKMREAKKDEKRARR